MPEVDSLRVQLVAPLPGYGLADFCTARGIPPLTGTQVVPVELFVNYGEWFQQQLVPDVENPSQVRRLERMGRGFRLELSDGEELLTDVVVMASGLNGFAHVPHELAAAAGQQGPCAGQAWYRTAHSIVTCPGSRAGKSR